MQTVPDSTTLSTAELRALHEFEEALIVIKQAIRKLRAPDDPALGANAMPLLWVVQRLQPTRVSDVAAELGLAVSTVSRRLEPLVQRGWLDAAPDPSDQRAHRLSLSNAGRNALRADRRRKMTRYTELLDAETRSQLPEMATFFSRVAQTLHAATEPGQSRNQRTTRRVQSTVTHE